MLEHLDGLLRHALVGRVAGITNPRQVRFQPPDDDWRTVVANLQVDGQPANAINVYLTELRDNRDLRSNERRRTVSDGLVRERPAPSRVDVHYLISAWSPAVASDQVEPTVDEHALLYRVLAVLRNVAPLNASRILPAGSAALDAVPEVIRDVDLPTTVAPADGDGKLSDFWGAMGQDHRWRPAIPLCVTLPVIFDERDVGPLVTTTTVVLGEQGGAAEPGRSHIGGTVLSSAGQPVADAWVALETQGSVEELTTTDASGRFRIGPIPTGRHHLRVRAREVGETSTEIEVPTPSGRYVVRFT